MELRFYSFINFYLSSIQQGIQTAHLVSDLMAENWETKSPAAMRMRRWARDHKTIITLNGGNAAMLEEFLAFLKEHEKDWDFCFTDFHEDEQSLNSAITGIGMVLPECIFNAELDPETGYYRYVSEDGPSSSYTFTHGPYWELIDRIKKCRLAN